MIPTGKPRLRDCSTDLPLCIDFFVSQCLCRVRRLDAPLPPQAAQGASLKRRTYYTTRMNKLIFGAADASKGRRVADPYKRTSKKARKNRQLRTTTLRLRSAVPYTQKSYPRDFPRVGSLFYYAYKLTGVILKVGRRLGDLLHGDLFFSELSLILILIVVLGFAVEGAVGGKGYYRAAAL